MKTQSELGRKHHSMQVRYAEGILIKTISRFVLMLSLALMGASNGFASTGASSDVCQAGFEVGTNIL